MTLCKKGVGRVKSFVTSHVKIVLVFKRETFIINKKLKNITMLSFVNNFFLRFSKMFDLMLVILKNILSGSGYCFGIAVLI